MASESRSLQFPGVARRCRWLVLPGIAIAAAILLLLPNDATAANDPREGAYESCAPFRDLDRCIDRLQHIRSGGFKAVLNYAQFYATEQELLAYADAAQSLGIKLIWPFKDRPWWGATSLRDEYPMLAQSCGCTGDRGFTEYVVRLLRGHPATWGYYVGDEAEPAQAQRITRFSKRVRHLDPNHPRLYVEIGDPQNLRDGLRRFKGAADVLGADVYPVGTTHPLSTVRTISRMTRDAARRHSRASAMVLQSFSWAQYPLAALAIRLPNPSWPSAGEMTTMRAMVDGHGHDLILWYSYFDVMRSANPALHWSALTSAAR